MATNFPSSVDDAATVGDGSHPSADEALSSTTGGPAHHALHQNVGLAINAIEDKVGTGSSAPAANTVLTGTGSGTSGWATVSTAMIGDDQVTQAKIADDAVGADQLAANAVVTASIVNDNVTQAKIAAGAVGNTKLADMGANTVKIRQSSSGAPQNVEIGTNAVLGRTTGALISTQVQEGMIADNAVTAAKLADDAVSAGDLTGGTLASGVTASSLTSVGTLGSLTVGGDVDINGLVKVDDGSASAPTFTFDSDEGNGMYLSGTDEVAFTTGGSQRVKITAGGTLQWIGSSAVGGPLTDTSTTTGYRYVLQNQTFGTFQDFDSSRARKEQITNVTATDSGEWIDALQPVTFIERWLGEGDEPADNKEWREADMQVGFISDDILASSNASHFAQATDNGEGGLDPAGWKWECVIAATVAELKSVRARLAALEG